MNHNIHLPSRVNRFSQTALDFDGPEATAQRALKETRCDSDEDPCPVRVAERLGIDVIYQPLRDMIHTAASRLMIKGRQFIWVRKGLPPQAEQFLTAHELGHVCVKLYGLEVHGEELWCNAFAGALLIPREPLRAVWKEPGDLPAALERWSHVPPTCVALRIGESGLADVAVTQGTSLRYVRSHRRVGPSMVKTGAEASRAGVARGRGCHGRRLPDVPRRAAVFLDDLDATA